MQNNKPFPVKKILVSFCLLGLSIFLLFPKSGFAQIHVVGIEGLTFTDSVVSYQIQLTETFTLHEMKVVPGDLVLKWEKNTSEFSFSGDATVTIEKDVLNISFGSIESPGLVIRNDSLIMVSCSVTSDFSMKSLKVKPKDLNFIYDKTESVYSLSGSIELDIEGDTIIAQFGTVSDPGIKIKDGSIEFIDIDITADFSLKSLKIKPKDLDFVYDKTESVYSLSGSIELDIEGDTIIAQFGTVSDPGIKIKDGSIEHIDIDITADFSLKSLKIKPTDLDFVYNKAESVYSLSGSIEFDIEGDTIIAQLGTPSNPGIKIEHGNIDKIYIAITSRIHLKGLEINTDTLGFSWQKENDAFHLFGDVNITIENNEIDFYFGDMQNPGLVFENGKISSYSIETNDDLHFGGLEVIAEKLTLQYHDNEYHVSGKLLIKELWKAEIDLGTGPGSGVTIKTENGKNTFEIEQAKFELGNIDLGPFTIKDLTIYMENNQMAEDSLSIEFPPGWEVDADLKFINGKLDGIDINWEALTIDKAIKLPGTGGEIIKIQGGVLNFHDPHNFQFKGDIGFAFGGPFNIPSVGDVSLLYLHAGTTITRSEFILEADALMGAHKDNTGWVSVLGDGHLKFDFKWGDYYSFDGRLNIPSDPWTILKADIEAKLSASGTLNAHMGVHLQVPPKIPIIGGHEFAEAEGIIHYDKIDPASYAAGWASINLGFYTANKGVKYIFKTKDYSTIGLKEINQIKTSGFDNSGYNPKHWDYLKINLQNENAHFIQVKVKFKQSLSRFFVDTYHPLSVGGISYSPIYLVSGIDQITSSGMNISTIPTYTYKWIENTDGIVFYIMAPGYKTDSKALLPTGEYTVELGNDISASMVQSYEVHKIFSAPYANWNYLYWNFEPEKVSGSGFFYVAKLNYHIASKVYNNDSASVRLFYTKHLTKNGELIKTVKYKDYFANYPPDGEYLKIEGLDFPVNYAAGDSLFLYLTIDDGINATFKSPVMYSHFTPPFQATVNVKGALASLSSGIETKLYLLNPHDNKWYASDSLKHFTNNSGVVSFPVCLNVPTSVKFVFDIPYGYEVDPDSPYKNGDILTVSNPAASCGKYVTMNIRKVKN